MIFLLLPKLKYSNKKIIFTQKNNFQMKKLLSKLFSYLPIMYSVMLRSYRNRILKLIFRGGVSVEDYAREMAGKLPDDV
jgi:hypothetical protein